jgi:hypothetical protein
MKYRRTREHGEHCITLGDNIRPGPFVLSVCPQSKKYISVATLLVP